MGEDFFRQTRRFSAAILAYSKGKQRGMAGKGPARRRSTVVNTGSSIQTRQDVFECRGFQNPYGFWKDWYGTISPAPPKRRCPVSNADGMNLISDCFGDSVIAEAIRYDLTPFCPPPAEQTQNLAWITLTINGFRKSRNGFIAKVIIGESYQSMRQGRKSFLPGPVKSSSSITGSRCCR